MNALLMNRERGRHVSILARCLCEQDMCGTCQAGLLIALFVGRLLNRGLADVVLLVPFLYASVQTLAPCTARSSLHGTSGEISQVDGGLRRFESLRV